MQISVRGFPQRFWSCIRCLCLSFAIYMEASVTQWLLLHACKTRIRWRVMPRSAASLSRNWASLDHGWCSLWRPVQREQCAQGSELRRKKVNSPLGFFSKENLWTSLHFLSSPFPACNECSITDCWGVLKISFCPCAKFLAHFLGLSHESPG